MFGKFTKSIFGISALLLFLLPLTSVAQISKYTIMVAPFAHDTSGKKYDQYMVECRSAALRFLLASGRFSVVERDATKELESERKLQKSESFIDGKVVEQSKAIGAEYILTGNMRSQTGMLSLVITSVADNLKVEGGECNLKDFMFLGTATTLSASQTYKKVNTAMSEIVSRWLAKDRYTVVKELEGDEDSTDKLLIAAGSARGVKKGMTLEVYYTTTETVDGADFERDILIGEAKIDLIENANFSVSKVKEGKKDIKKALLEGKKLYSRPKTKK